MLTIDVIVLRLVPRLSIVLHVDLVNISTLVHNDRIDRIVLFGILFVVDSFGANGFASV